MARYLAYTSPARGHLYPIVPTLLELRDRGHEVHVRTLASECAALNALGLHAAPIADAIEATPLADFEGTSMEEALAKALGTFTERARHEVPDLRGAIADTDPDALLVDITTVGAAALADAVGLPWAQSIPLLQSFTPGPGAPPMFGLVPYCLAPELGLEVLNGPRRELGLAPLTSPDEVWRAPLYLYYTEPPLESPDLGFPPSFRFVGSGLWEPPAAAPAWLDELPEPLVVVSASSEFQRDHALIETALLALADEPVGSPSAPPPTIPRRSCPRSTLAWSGGCRTARCCRARRASFATAAWASRRRRWPRACHCASSRSGATSSRSAGASRPSAPAPSCRPTHSARMRCEPPSARRSPCATEHGRSPTQSPAPEARLQPPRRSKPSSCRPPRPRRCEDGIGELEIHATFDDVHVECSGRGHSRLASASRRVR